MANTENTLRRVAGCLALPCVAFPGRKVNFSVVKGVEFLKKFSLTFQTR